MPDIAHATATLARTRAASRDADCALDERTVIDLSATMAATCWQPSTDHVGALPRLDDQGRVNVRTVTDPLGWPTGVRLVVAITRS